MEFLDKTGLERLWEHIISRLGNKVDIIEGKGLSTNDYTEIDKSKVDSLVTIAMTGSYNDLVDRPFYTDTDGAVVYLDEKYIPDTIARVSDIPETYALPVATSTSLGGVMPVEATEAMTQPVGVDANGSLYTEAISEISDADIDTICGSTIVSGQEVSL